MSQGAQEMLEAVGLDLVHRGEHVAEFAFGETVAAEPDEVGVGQVDKITAFEFTERHAGVGELDQIVQLEF